MVIRPYRQSDWPRLCECQGELSLEVLVGNEAALLLYLSEGFEIIKRTDGRLVGNETFAASGYLLERKRKFDEAVGPGRY